MFSKSFVCLVIFSFCYTCQAQCLNMTYEEDSENDDIVFRIQHGRYAKLGDVPYQIAFKARIPRRGIYGTFCGGSLIKTNKIVSAAHCFVKKTLSNCFQSGVINKLKLSQKFAVAGSLNTRAQYNHVDSLEEGQWRELTRVSYPKTYDFPKDDISVVTLARPFVLNKYVQPIPYATRYEDYSKTCLASGYGRIDKWMQTDSLLLANLQIIPHRQCDRIHRKRMKNFVCTSSMISDVGKGDSGGPLVCKGTINPNEGSNGILVGVTSGKRLYRRDGSYFTRVSSYSNFIQNNSDVPKRVTKTLLYCLYILLYHGISLF